MKSTILLENLEKQQAQLKKEKSQFDGTGEEWQSLIDFIQREIERVKQEIAAK